MSPLGWIIVLHLMTGNPGTETDVSAAYPTRQACETVRTERVDPAWAKVSAGPFFTFCRYGRNQIAITHDDLYNGGKEGGGRATGG